MKIVIADTTIDEDLIGGGHLYLPGLMKNLVAEGNQVHLVTKGVPNKKVASYIEDSGAILHSDVWNKNWYVEKTAPQLAAWVNKLEPDVFLISASNDIAWVALPLLNPSIATLTIGHTDSETFYLPARHYHNFLTGAIGVSPQVCEQYQSNCGIDKTKITWIPYGVEAAEKINNYSENAIISLVYAGRIDEEQKRISDVGKIIKKLSESGVAYKITIIGDGPEMPSLKNTIAEELSDGRAVLTGWLPNKEVIEIFRQSEVFLLTSAYEGFCIALTEAMANGCCPIVTNIRSGNSKLIDNTSNGVIKEIGDVDGFVATIKKLQADPAGLMQMRTKAWQTGYEYGIKRMVENFKQCFETTVKETRLNPRKQDISFPLMPSCVSKYPLWLRSIKAFFKSIRA